MLGVSVYLGQALTADDYNSLVALRNAGFGGVFTSLLLPEDDPEDVLRHLTELVKWCKNLGLKLTADVSAQGLARLGIDVKNWNQVASLHVDSLRIDDGISPDTIAALTKKMPIALNASTLSDDDVYNLRQAGADFEQLEAWNNFYPRPETGLDRAWYAQRLAWLHQQGFKVQAFIPGNKNVRGPIFAGLPTIEDHRGKSPFAAALDLKQMGTDAIFIGDSDLADDTLEQFTSYFKEHKLLLRTEEDLPTLFEHEWHQRPDLSRDVIRLKEGRLRQLFPVVPQPAQERSRGTITVDNSDYLRYQGELQITKKDLPANPRVNVLGHIVDEDCDLLQFIGPDELLAFKQK
ncbi:DUF871 domain-containing protein [Lactobacillus corticis]|uniref:Membrane protein n=1 Tax=Lactobacillus corticis TaxID=2201249 RepID=A0A916QI30_9LACO|nr:MupG family TIM beta-alpha barrel fold protein [Lactobacillus corticis]GFZ26422.1 membrane protein [Lactobacillus corticis]